MIRDQFLAFDDEIRGTTTYYTSEELQTRLASYDRIAVGCDVRSSTSSGTVSITAALEHSGDGRHFAVKYLNAGFSTLLFTWVPPAYATSGADDGAYPGLPFMRIAFQGNNIGAGTFTRARVRLYVTLRDIGGGKPFRVARGYH